MALSHTEFKNNITSPNRTITLICQYAKQKNNEALVNLIKSGICVNIQDKDGSAICRIACEKPMDKQALKLLLSHGACIQDASYGAGFNADSELIDELMAQGGSIHSVVNGAADAGHFELVENLICKGASLDAAVKGAAHAGYFEQVDNFMSRGASIEYAVVGAAKGGHFIQVKALIKRGALLKHVVCGLVLGGYLDQTFEYLNNDILLTNTVYGAALIGCIEFVEKYINKPSLLDAAAQGAAFGGHTVWLKDLIQRGASLNNALTGAVRGGNYLLADDLLHQGALLRYAAYGAAYCGNFVKLREYESRGKSDITDILFGLAYGGYFKEINNYLDKAPCIENVFNNKDVFERFTEMPGLLRFLILFKNPLREKIADKAKEYSRIKFDTSNVLSRLDQIDSVMFKRQISFEQSLAWETEEIKGLMIYARFNTYLPTEICFLIALFLSPFLKNEKEVKDLSKKISIDVRKTALMLDIKSHPLKSKYLFWHDETPLMFNQKCQQAESEEQLDKYLADEIQLLANSKDESYVNLLRRHTIRK